MLRNGPNHFGEPVDRAIILRIKTGIRGAKAKGRYCIVRILRATTRALLALLIVRLCIFEAAIFSGQNSIELFHKGKECVPVFLYSNKRAQLLNALGVSFIHRRTGGN